jgi:hypothetical protein
MSHHLAQVNIATLRAPLDHPSIHGFTSRLEEINALADASPGFVWRLQTEAGDATSLRPYDDDRVIVNMSVWESAQALKDFVYRSHHVQLIKQKAQWFHRPTLPVYALWWIPAGTLPTVEEAKQRLDHLQAAGDSPFAFSFARLFEPGEVDRSTA